MTERPAYEALCALRLRVYNLEHVQAIASWDRMTYMPRGSISARSAAQAELGAVIQSMQSDPSLDDLVARAAGEKLGFEDQANLSLIRRERLIATAVPEKLAARRVEAVGTAWAAWDRAKAANDWAPFGEALVPLVEVVREIAERLGEALELSRYDALLDGFDRGLRRQKVDRLFGEIAHWLPEVVRSTIERQASDVIVEPVGPFDVEAQRRVCTKAMEALGFDFSNGRLDVSVHPFTGGTPEDVRLTTRYREDQCLPALLGIIHETGHGRYQAGLPRRWRGQPLGEPCSASMHEAQALLFERQLAPTPEFVAMLSEFLAGELGHQPAFEPANLERLMTRVRPGAIRVDADEMTYPAHIILRTRIEADLIEGEIEVADIPALWNEGMETLLGIDVRDDPVRGPLQDIHWSQGMFGYFPAYLIGAVIAAQLFETFNRAVEPGDGEGGTSLSRLGDWLSEHVWSRGAAKTTEALVRDVTGAPISPDALRAHFQRRYGIA